MKLQVCLHEWLHGNYILVTWGLHVLLHKMLHALLHETLHVFTCLLPHSVHDNYMIGYISFISIITWSITWYYIILQVFYITYYMADYTDNYMTFHCLLHGFLHVVLHDFTWYYMITECVTWNLHILLHD